MRQSEGFRFKQFYVRHDRCAMKVGTDGVLLGCCAEPAADREQSPLKVLDIGTGSGLIALMLAQRYANAEIDAIDIDGEAVAQAVDNFRQSPWAERLHAYCERVQERQGNRSYDLIVSNPPYFENSLKNPDAQRRTARHTDSLSYEELIFHSERLLAEGGQIAVIVPAEAETDLIALGEKMHLQLTRVTRVYSKEGKRCKRVIMTFCRATPATGIRCSGGAEAERLVLEDGKGGRSAAYQEMTKDFYL